VQSLGEYLKVTCHVFVGGTNVREDMDKLRAGVQVVVGTPGRVHDMINRGALGKQVLIILGTHAYFCLCRHERHEDVHSRRGRRNAVAGL
jgi:hypothetical protein